MDLPPLWDNFIIAVKTAITVLELFENVNRAVQSSRNSVSSMISVMQMTADTLNNLRTDSTFQVIYDEAVALCQDLDLPLPTVPRQRRPPKCYTGPSATHVWATTDDYFRSQFFQFVDTVVSQLKVRYEQPGLHRYARWSRCGSTSNRRQSCRTLWRTIPIRGDKAPISNLADAVGGTVGFS